jgi:uncharacterized protein (TIRG00374 family)
VTLPEEGLVARSRSTLIFVARLALGIAVLWGCLAYVGLEELPAAVSAVDPAALLIALVLTFVGSILLPAILTYRALAISESEFTLLDLVLLNLDVRFYVLVLPRPAAVGARWARYRSASSGGDALALMAFERLIQLGVLTLAAVCFLVLERSALPPGAHGLLLGLASLLLLALAGALLPFVSEGVSGRLESWLDRSNADPSNLLQRVLTRLLEAVGAYQALSLTKLLGLVMLSTASFALFVAVPWVLVTTMDLPVSIGAIAWIRSVVFLMTLLPITVGGLGVREVGFVALLQLYSVSEASALALSLVLFALQGVLGLIGAMHVIWTNLIRPVLGRSRGEDS